MSVLQYPETFNSKELQIWDNEAFDNGESEGSTVVKLSWNNIKSISSNLSQSLESDLTKENQSLSMVESPVSLKSLKPIKPLNSNNIILNTQKIPISKPLEERNLDYEIEKIEKEINRLSSNLESLRLEKVKRNAKVMEKRGKVVAAKFMDKPKESIKECDEQGKIEELMDISAELKTPRRGLSMGPSEIMRGARRGISIGPVEIYSATKLKQFGKQEISTNLQPSSNRRKSCYWKLQDIDELRVTKERGKSLSVSPKSRYKLASKVLAPKQAVTTIGSKKTVKKEKLISSIQPKKLFTKDGEESAPTKKPLKSGKVVASRYNKISNGANSGIKEVKKRSLPENEDDLRRFDKKRASLAGKSQGVEAPTTENRVKKGWEIPSEVVVKKSADHETPLSVSKMLNMVPKIKTFRCLNESPRDSGPAKRVSELDGRKSYFTIDNGNDDKVEESVCQALDFTEEQIIKECPRIRVPHCINESPRDSGGAKRVSELVGRKPFFNEDVHDKPFGGGI